MIRPFLSINSNENLTVRNLDADNKDLVLEVDINSDYDGSLRKFATFVRENNINSFSCSSTIDDSDENGIDSMMLDTFLDSVWNYKVIQMAGFVHKDSLEIEGDIREAYFAWLADMEDVSIKSNAEYIIEKSKDLDVEDIPF